MLKLSTILISKVKQIYVNFSLKKKLAVSAFSEFIVTKCPKKREIVTKITIWVMGHDFEIGHGVCIII